MRSSDWGPAPARRMVGCGLSRCHHALVSTRHAACPAQEGTGDVGTGMLRAPDPVTECDLEVWSEACGRLGFF